MTKYVPFSGLPKNKEVRKLLDRLLTLGFIGHDIQLFHRTELENGVVIDDRDDVIAVVSKTPFVNKVSLGNAPLIRAVEIDRIAVAAVATGYLPLFKYADRIYYTKSNVTASSSEIAHDVE